MTAHPLQLLRQLAVADQQDMQRHALPEEGLPPALDFSLSQQAFCFGSLQDTVTATELASLTVTLAELSERRGKGCIPGRSGHTPSIHV